MKSTVLRPINSGSPLRSGSISSLKIRKPAVRLWVSSTGTIGHVRMQGNQVFRHAVEKLASTAASALDKAGLGADDLDWIVPHQANIRIIQGTAKKMGLPSDKVGVTVQDHGNTSAAAIPMALSVGGERGEIKRGDLLVTEAIGGGLAWGAVVLRW